MPYGSNQLSFRYQYVRIPYTDYGMLCLPQQFVQVVGAIENRFFVMHETVAYPFMMSEKEMAFFVSFQQVNIYKRRPEQILQYVDSIRNGITILTGGMEGVSFIMVVIV